MAKRAKIEVRAGPGYFDQLRSQGEMKKRRIRRIAARVFAERGVLATGLNRVGAAAQMALHAIEYYYHNREELLSEVLVEHVVTLTERVGAAHDATADADPATRLEALTRAFLEAVRADQNEHRALLFNAHHLPAQVQFSVRERFRILVGTLAETLAETAPGLGQPQTEALGLILMSAITGSAFWFGDTAPADGPLYTRLVCEVARAVAAIAAAEGPMAETGIEVERPVPAVPIEEMSPALRPVTWGWCLPGAPQAALPRPASGGTAVAVVPGAAGGNAEDGANPTANWVPGHVAQRKFFSLVAAVGEGAHFVITNHGWPVAKLVPAGQEAPRLKRAEG